MIAKPKKKSRKLLVALTALVLVGGGVAYAIATQNFPVKQAQDVKMGKIEVTTDPEDAKIILDGKEQRKRSNTTFKTREGEHTIKLELTGHDSQEIKVFVRPDATTPVEHAFTKDGKSILSTPKAGESAFKTYKNDRYGYTIQYPSTWAVNTDPEGVAHFYNEYRAKQLQKEKGQEGQSHSSEEYESMTILVLPNPGNLSSEAWYKAREEYAAEDQSQIKQQAVTIGGLPGYRWETPYGFVPYVNTVVTGKANTFLMQIKQNSPDQSIYNELIQTFKLL